MRDPVCHSERPQRDRRRSSWKEKRSLENVFKKSPREGILRGDFVTPVPFTNSQWSYESQRSKILTGLHCSTTVGPCGPLLAKRKINPRCGRHCGPSCGAAIQSSFSFIYIYVFSNPRCGTSRATHSFHTSLPSCLRLFSQCFSLDVFLPATLEPPCCSRCAYCSCSALSFFSKLSSKFFLLAQRATSHVSSAASFSSS